MNTTTLLYGVPNVEDMVYMSLPDSLSRAGFSSSKAIKLGNTRRSDIIFGGNNNVYGVIGYNDYNFDTRYQAFLKIVVEDPIPKPQHDAVTELLLQLPMFSEVEKGIETIKRA